MTVAKNLPEKPRKLPKESMLPMNREEFVWEVAKKGKCELDDAVWMVDTVLEVMAKQIVTGRGLRITGLGSFLIVKRGARLRRNPQTGGMVKVGGENVIKFNPAQRLKDLVNGNLKLARGQRIVTKKPKTEKAPKDACES